MTRKIISIQFSMCTTAGYEDSFLAEFILEDGKPRVMSYMDDDSSVGARKNRLVTLELKESSPTTYYFANVSVKASVSKNVFDEKNWAEPFAADVVFPHGSYHRAELVYGPVPFEPSAK